MYPVSGTILPRPQICGLIWWYGTLIIGAGIQVELEGIAEIGQILEPGDHFRMPPFARRVVHQCHCRVDAAQQYRTVAGPVSVAARLEYVNRTGQIRGADQSRFFIPGEIAGMQELEGSISKQEHNALSVLG